MTEETEKEAFITLNFSGTEKEFSNIGELRDFIQLQLDAWFWLEQAARQDDNLAQVWDPFKRYFKQVNQLIEWLEWHPDDQKEQINLVNIFREQTQAAAVQGFILAETPEAQFILELKDNKSPQIAGYALAFLNNKKISASNLASYEGAYWTMNYLQGSTTTSLDEQQKIYDAVALAWTDRFEMQRDSLGKKNKKLITDTTELQEQSALLIKKVNAQVTMQKSEFENQSSDLAILFKKIHDEAGKKLTNFEASLRAKIVLEESIKYWEEKRIQHRKTMLYMAIASVGLSVLTLAAFILITIFYLSTTIETVSPRHISALLAISTFGVWLTRLSTKIFISNLHLETDAYERVTMVKTYFALLAEGKPLNKDEHELILQTLFRPSSSGIVKDDGPTNILETLVKALKRR